MVNAEETFCNPCVFFDTFSNWVSSNNDIITQGSSIQMSLSSNYFEEKNRQGSQLWPCSGQKLDDGEKNCEQLTSRLFSLIRLDDAQQAEISDEKLHTTLSDISSSDDNHVIQYGQDLEYNSIVFENVAPKCLRTPVCVTCPLILEELRWADVSEDKVFLDLSRGIWKNPESYSKSSFILATPNEVEASFPLHCESPFIDDSSCSVESQEGLEFDPMCLSYYMERENNSMPSFAFIPIQQQTCDGDGTTIDDVFESAFPTLKPKRTYHDISDCTFD